MVAEVLNLKNQTVSQTFKNQTLYKKRLLVKLGGNTSGTIPIPLIQYRYMLYDTLIKHCIGDLYKSPDIGTINIVVRSTVFFSSINTSAMNTLHN